MVDLNNLYSGYQQASTYNPVDKKLLLRAIKPYGFTFNSTIGKSDTQLRRMAAKVVVDRYLAKKAAKK